MSLGTIVSPYRHIYGEPAKPQDSYADVLVSTAAIDTNMLAANARFVAIPWESRGGGTFSVLKADGKGKIGQAAPLFEGHKAPVIDVAFNPFNDYVVASAAEDATIKLWKIAEAGGQVAGNKDPYASLTGHARKVGRVVFNPLVDNALASFGAENAIKLWDITKASAVSTIKGPSGQFLDINWSQDGNRLVLPAKDKRVHAYDVRAGTEILSVPGHPGLKGGRAVFYDKLNYIATTGFGQSAARLVAVRDTRNPDKALQEEDVDYNSGVFITFIDADAGVLYLFGRGDTNARYYELRSESPFILALSQYALTEPIRAVAHAPKYVVNSDACEIDRFYVITQSKALLALPMIVPRRNAEGTFQEDLYPPTIGPEPSIGFDAWKAGEEFTPKTISLEGGVQLAAARDVGAVAAGGGDDVDALKAEIARLQARVAELEAQLAA
jgi:WD40 repeat protein